METLTQFVPRPGPCTLGRAIRVHANFFEVTSLPTVDIVHYDVTVTPDVPPALNRRVYQMFEDEQHAIALGGAKAVFDG
jgi:eukaryotic translation initiation factor 2C